MPLRPYGGEQVDYVSGLSPSIHASVTSGDFPLVVQMTAHGSSGTGLDLPWEKAHYEWDFGDPVYPNTNSTMGMNMAPVTYHNPEWVFVDIMKHAKAWDVVSAGTLTLDDKGHLLGLNGGAEAVTYMYNGISQYPAGVYTCYYEGSGTLEWGQDATVESSGLGRETVIVAPSGGISLKVTSMSSVHPIRDIKLIMPGFEKNGQYKHNPFHPTFLDRLKHNKVLRYMNWAEVNNSVQSTWDSRTTPAFNSQVNPYGVAVEYQIQLANTLKIDPWFCLPHLADDDYITQMATLIRDTLDTELKCYFEWSNEVWNYGFTAAGWHRDQGFIAFPELNPESQSDIAKARRRYYGDKSVAMFDIFETVFGGTSRLNRVLAEQRSTSAYNAEDLLDHIDPTKVDSFSVPMYFGGRLQDDNPVTGTVEAWDVGDMMDWVDVVMTGNLARCETIYNSVSNSPYNIPAFVAYEGGQSILGDSYNSNATIANLIDDACRHPRMKATYTNMLSGWENFGGGIFCAFSSCDNWGTSLPKLTRWGHLEYQDQDRTGAPRYDALLSYAENQTAPMRLYHNARTSEVAWTNSDQVGPNATHPYRQTGEYTVTLTMVIQDTDGVEQTGITTQDITVVDTFTDLYIDSVNGDDSNDGSTLALAKQSYGAYKTGLETSISNQRIYLAAGSEWTPYTGAVYSSTGLRIQRIGPGEDPLFTCTGTHDTTSRIPFRQWARDRASNDVLLQGIHIDGGKEEYSTFKSVGPYERTGIHLLDCTFEASYSNLLMITSTGATHVSFIGCDFNHYSGRDQGLSILMNPHDYLTNYNEFLTVMACSFTGGNHFTGAGDNLVHAIYPSGRRWYDLYRWINFIGPDLSGTSQIGYPGYNNQCINTNCQNSIGEGLDNEYVLTDGCDFKKWKNGVDHGAGGPGGADATPESGRFNHVIHQNNAFHDFRSSLSDCFHGLNLANVTIRDNIFYKLGNSITYSVSDPALVGRIYRNKAHGNLAGSSDRFWRMNKSGQNWTMYDNSWHLTSGNNNRFIEYADDPDVDYYSSGNNYYSPTLTSPFEEDGSARTFTQWQAETFTYDETNLDPGWLNAYDGDFSLQEAPDVNTLTSTSSLPAVTVDTGGEVTASVLTSTSTLLPVTVTVDTGNKVVTASVLTSIATLLPVVVMTSMTASVLTSTSTLLPVAVMTSVTASVLTSISTLLSVSVSVDENANVILVGSPTVTFEVSNIIPIIKTEPPRPSPINLPSFSIPIDEFTRVIPEIGKIKDSEILPILVELSDINNDITKASINSKTIWTQQVLDNASSSVLHRTLVNMTAANYSSFARRANDPSNRVVLNRKRF